MRFHPKPRTGQQELRLHAGTGKHRLTPSLEDVGEQVPSSGQSTGEAMQNSEPGWQPLAPVLSRSCTLMPLAETGSTWAALEMLGCRTQDMGHRS